MIITHKLQEVLALSDRVAILRKGKYFDTVETAQANAQSLSASGKRTFRRSSVTDPIQSHIYLPASEYPL